MKESILSELLLIQEPSVLKLYEEMMKITGYFVAPVFTIALLTEYFGEMNFGSVVRKLLLITIFMGSFHQFHTKAVELSLEAAGQTLKKVSPRNLFVKKWFTTKVKTKEKKQWNFLESFAVPNLNDLIATSFFLLAKVFLWLLKLIYSSVYHLTYVFSGLTAILYFLGWTKDALKGTFQASLWCMILPFVIVAIFALVGNSIDEEALSGGLIIAKVDTIIWLFGITLLLLISPVITYGMVRGEGIHSFGSKMGAMVVSSGLKAAALAPVLARFPERASRLASHANHIKENAKSRISAGKRSEVQKHDARERLHSEGLKTKEEGKPTHSHSKSEEKSIRYTQGQNQNHFNKSTPVVSGKQNNMPQKQQQASHTKTNTEKGVSPLRQNNTAPQIGKSSRDRISTNEVRNKELKTQTQGKTQVLKSKTERIQPQLRREPRELR